MVNQDCFLAYAVFFLFMVFVKTQTQEYISEVIY